MKGLLIALAVALLFAVAIAAVQQAVPKPAAPAAKPPSAPVTQTQQAAQPAPTSAEDANNAAKGKEFMDVINILLNPQLPAPKPSNTSSGTQPSDTQPTGNQGNSASTSSKPILTPTPTSTPQPTNSNVLQQILSFAELINSRLEPGSDKSFNRLVNPPSNAGYQAHYRDGKNEATWYWCTDLVIDAYNLAGIKGLSTSAHEAVVTMRDFWKRTSGLSYISYDNGDHLAALNQTQPGCAVFFEKVAGTFTGSEHVAIVKNIKIDERGNGTLTTIDSNASHKVNSYPIAQGMVKNTWYPLRGFGCVAQ